MERDSCDVRVSVSESSVESRMRPCQQCAQAIGNQDATCPSCGAEQQATVGVRMADTPPLHDEGGDTALGIKMITIYLLVLGALIWLATGSLLITAGGVVAMFAVGCAIAGSG